MESPTNDSSIQAAIIKSESQEFEFESSHVKVTKEILSNGKARVITEFLSDKFVVDGVFAKKVEEIKQDQINRTDPLFWL